MYGDIEMSKKTQKTQKSQESQKSQSRPTITRHVLDVLSSNPTIGTIELIDSVVHAFPWSKFSKTHVAWYKHQIRKGLYSLANGNTLPPAKRKVVTE